ncbi:hypothetical protein AURDEDRAFT_178712 [Auricularia subglabra TFB-10046 SS5]|uniref:F-box domain-containing protein n=1 Tax=Auricularia subglabra (strain TFB-10046 / SS5) TaxID=717982 RepID=J0L7F8_AURST|nr:hypothetical protein AURDEDRAFT_178712 [Auricularia subglabra TFB-10046 SS5]
MGVKVAWQSTFPGVTHANIDDIDDARGLLELFLHMPNLISLDVYAANLLSDDVPADFSLRCNHLETLNLTIGDECDDDMPHRLEFPSLRKAYLCFSDPSVTADATLTAFLQYPLHTVEELTLDALEAAMLDGLQYLQRLTMLHFVFYDDTSDAALKGLSKADEHGVWLCPKLIHVTLPVDVPSVYLEEIILSLVHARGPDAWPPEKNPPAQLQSLKLKDPLVPSAEPHRSRFTALIDDLLDPTSSVSRLDYPDWTE